MEQKIQAANNTLELLVPGEWSAAATCVKGMDLVRHPGLNYCKKEPVTV